MLNWRRRCNHCGKIVICGTVSLVKMIILQNRTCPKCDGRLDLFQIGSMKMQIR